MTSMESASDFDPLNPWKFMPGAKPSVKTTASVGKLAGSRVLVSRLHACKRSAPAVASTKVERTTRKHQTAPGRVTEVSGLSAHRAMGGGSGVCSVGEQSMPKARDHVKQPSRAGV